MSRPLRLELSNAWYHVMNRGAGYRDIFNNDTQRYNRLEDADGPLFRGCYKAILIEPDAYLLNVSRYIHLNPVSAGVASLAEEYQWSSYRAYTGIAATPEWLQTKFVLNMFGKHQQQKLCRLFVEKGVDEETQTFYDKKKFPSIMGSDNFKESVRSKLPTDVEIPEIKTLKTAPSFSSIIQAVSVVFATPEEQILRTTRGRGKKNIARSAAIYYCRKMTGLPLNEIAKQFGLNHYGSVSGSVAKFDQQINENSHLAELMHKVDNQISE